MGHPERQSTVIYVVVLIGLSRPSPLTQLRGGRRRHRAHRVRPGVQDADLRKKLLFTLGIIVVYRVGTHIPIPGVNYKAVQQCVTEAGANQGLFGLVNMFSGGALLQITVFALGIMPYITASIILQLLTVVIPRLEALKKEGSAGTAKITQYTRYLTVALAILQGTGLVATARSGALFNGCSVASSIVPDQAIFTTITMVVCMTAGTAVVMWLGELVTDRGIGNGMSILMFISIAATFPSALWAIKKQGSLAGGWIEFGTVSWWAWSWSRSWSSWSRPSAASRCSTRSA